MAIEFSFLRERVPKKKKKVLPSEYCTGGTTQNLKAMKSSNGDVDAVLAARGAASFSTLDFSKVSLGSKRKKVFLFSFLPFLPPGKRVSEGWVPLGILVETDPGVATPHSGCCTPSKGIGGM